MLWGGIYPGMITATIGTALLIAVVVTSLVIVRRRLRYEWWYAVHLTGVRGDRARLVPPDPDRQRARARPHRGRLLARALPRDARPARRLPRRRAARQRVPLPAARRRGRRGRPGRRLAADHAAAGSTGCSAQPGQFFLWRFLARGRWWASHPFSLSAAPDGRSLRITVKALGDFTGRIRRDRGRARASSPRGRSASSPSAVRRREKVAADRRRHRHHADPRAARGDARRRRRPLPRRCTTTTSSSATSSTRSRASAASTLHYVVGDHATDEGARLLSPEHLRELVPDIAERDVYLCGPPAMTDAIGRTSATRASRAAHPRRTLRPLRKEPTMQSIQTTRDCERSRAARSGRAGDAALLARRRRRSWSRRRSPACRRRPTAGATSR